MKEAEKGGSFFRPPMLHGLKALPYSY